MQLGDKIRVTVRKIDDWIFASQRETTATYEGVVVRSERWDPAETFSLLTGRPDHPVSVIATKNVVNIEHLGKGSTKAPSDGTKSIYVISEKGNQHRLKVHNSGFVDCDCAGFGYRRRCSHRDLALAWLVENHGDNWKESVFK